MTNQVKFGDEKGGARKREADAFEEKKKKKMSEQQNALLASLLKNAQSAKGMAVADEADQRKIDLYRDPREGTDKMPPDTIITCKHFLEAVESELYGWRWVCPMDGENCRYRHMLPVGWVLTTKAERAKMAADEKARKEDDTTLEEKIEEARMALKSDDLTPVTAESFAAWKVRRAEKRQKELEDKMKEEELKAASKGGKGGGPGKKGKNIMNGRALFKYNPDLFQDDEQAADAGTYEEGDEHEPEEKK